VLAFRKTGKKSEGTDLRIREVDRKTWKGISGTVFGREMGNSGNERDRKYRTCGGPFFSPLFVLPPTKLAKVHFRLAVSSAERMDEAFCDRDPARALVLIRDIAMVPEDQYGKDE